jgi:hypothetical protein
MHTGKERDAETGLDFFHARYLSGAQGRFTSLDASYALMWCFPESLNRKHGCSASAPGSA